jgi:hypothetical protein
MTEPKDILLKAVNVNAVDTALKQIQERLLDAYRSHYSWAEVAHCVHEIELLRASLKTGELK